jgi:hypothetical protein
MIRVEKSGREDIPFLVTLKMGQILFSRDRLIELRDKINRALKETKPEAPSGEGAATTNRPGHERDATKAPPP